MGIFAVTHPERRSRLKIGSNPKANLRVQANEGFIWGRCILGPAAAEMSIRKDSGRIRKMRDDGSEGLSYGGAGPVDLLSVTALTRAIAGCYSVLALFGAFHGIR